MILRIVWILLMGAFSLFSQENSLASLSKSIHKPIPSGGAIVKIHKNKGLLLLKDESLKQFAKGNLSGSEEECDILKRAGHEMLIRAQNKEIIYYHRSPSLSLENKFKTYKLTFKENDLYFFDDSSLPSTLSGCSLGIKLPVKEREVLRSKGILIDLRNHPVSILHPLLFLECPCLE